MENRQGTEQPSDWKAPVKAERPKAKVELARIGPDLLEESTMDPNEIGKTDEAQEEPLESFSTVDQFKKALGRMVDTTRAALPFGSRVESAPTQAAEDDDIKIPDTFLQKIGKSKMARALFGLGGLISVGKSLEAGSAALERSQDQETAVQELRLQASDIGYESVTDEPDPDASVTLKDGTEFTIGELQGMIDATYSDQLSQLKDQHGNRWGGYSTLKEAFPTTLPDGSAGVDALHATIFNPELQRANAGISQEAFDLIGQAHGMTGEDVKLYDSMQREALWFTADMGGLPYMHEAAQTSPLGFDTDALKVQAQEFADDISRDALQLTDLDNADEATQQRVVEAIRGVINAELNLQKERIDTVASVQGGENEDISRMAMEDWTDREGNFHEAQIDQLKDAEAKAELATKILAESDPRLKPIADQLMEKHQSDAVKFRESAAGSGYNQDFWQQQVQEVADKDAS